MKRPLTLIRTVLTSVTVVVALAGLARADVVFEDDPPRRPTPAADDGSAPELPAKPDVDREKDSEKKPDVAEKQPATEGTATDAAEGADRPDAEGSTADATGAAEPETAAGGGGDEGGLPMLPIGAVIAGIVLIGLGVLVARGKSASAS